MEDISSQVNNKSNSWEIYGDSIAIKKCDLSFFHYHGTGIPKETLSFWYADSLKNGEKKYIKVCFKNVIYSAYLIREKNEDGRVRLFWYSDLSNEFKKLHPKYQMYNYEDYPFIRFVKKEKDVYDAEFFDNEEGTNDNSDLESVIRVAGNAEGKKILYYTTKYERNPQNRRDCLKYHGVRCAVCGFDFEERYGHWGHEYAEVHHKKPLNSLEEEIIINPKTDLVPVCSNCHRMIHRRRDRVLTIEELKQSSPDSCVKCYTMFLPFLLIKIDVFS